ncbi:MAG: adenine nucleotide alpha hydrolase [Chitinophagales bacterium]|nr:adenine nucleotide alpha hydrolase [Chitinophagales bacterium]
MVKTVLNWSSGKDAALAYHLLRQDERYDVTTLLTTVNSEKDRVVMHGVREQLLDMQAERMGIRHKKVHLPPSPSHDVYNEAMTHVLAQLKQENITTAAFGDIFLEDLRRYREDQLATAGFKGIFPVWGMDTRDMVQLVDNVGIEAVIVCVNEAVLGKEFLGRKIDSSLLNDLPAGVDPCGENGEFHTFVYNAPYFKAPIPIQLGEVVHTVYPSPDPDKGEGYGFWFLDLYV